MNALTLTNVFWRIEPKRGADPHGSIESSVMTSPAEFLAKARRGDGVVLAMWAEDEEEGRIYALGVVQEVDKGRSARVDWRRANFTLRPSPSGRTQWRTRPSFKFAQVVADRYRLVDYFADAFGTHSTGSADTHWTDDDPPNRAAAPRESPAVQRSEDPRPVTRAPRPLCNRVAPDGTIFATPSRGMFMGNRTSPPRWLVCDLHFERNLKVPRKYTKLFFLDEAVALAAGHRPCKTCRADRYDAYLAAASRELDVSGAVGLDKLLNIARRNTKTSSAISLLPDGAYIRLDDNDFRLKWRGALHRWTPAGYVDPVWTTSLGADEVDVITPEPSPAALRNGYRCEVHASASQS